MKKRKNPVVIIISIVLMSMFLTGCDGGDHESAYIEDENTQEESSTSSKSEESEGRTPPEIEGLKLIREVEVELNGHRDLYQFILYDPETNIMFSYVEWIDGGGVFEMHNPDGSPRLYDPK